MFLGIQWYWWVVTIVIIAIIIPLKVRFISWWSKHLQEKKEHEHGKWGDDE